MLIVEQIMQILFYLHRFNKYRRSRLVFFVVHKIDLQIMKNETFQVPYCLRQNKQTNENGIQV